MNESANISATIFSKFNGFNPWISSWTFYSSLFLSQILRVQVSFFFDFDTDESADFSTNFLLHFRLNNLMIPWVVFEKVFGCLLGLLKLYKTLKNLISIFRNLVVDIRSLFLIKCQTELSKFAFHMATSGHNVNAECLARTKGS